MTEVIENEFVWTVLEEPNYVSIVSTELWFKEFQVSIVLEFIAEWATVPFIARYKKEKNR